MNQQRVDMLRRRILWKSTKTRASEKEKAENEKVGEKEGEDTKEKVEKREEDEMEEGVVKEEEDMIKENDEQKMSDERRELGTDPDLGAPVNPFIVQLLPMQVRAWLVQVQR